MHAPIRTIAGIAACIALLSGCASASTTPRWDRDFGTSVRATLASQIIDPGAARNTNPVAGLDGRTALGAQERYEHSDHAPSSPTGTMVSGSGK